MNYNPTNEEIKVLGSVDGAKSGAMTAKVCEILESAPGMEREEFLENLIKNIYMF